MLEGVYIFVVSDADSRKHRTIIETPSLSMIIVGVEDYDEASEVAGSPVAEGTQFIGLCRR
jgi:hypothetical protein